MRVLAFDAATTVGWALFADARAVPLLGTFTLEGHGCDYGRLNCKMLGVVRMLIREQRPEVIAFEAPIFMPRDKWHTRRLLVGLVTIIELAAAMANLPCVEVVPREAKQCLTGDQYADKKAMVAAAETMGWPVEDDHQADACAVALVAYGHLARPLVSSLAVPHHLAS